MDTDELSKETYKAIIIEAEKFHYDLTLQFGLVSYDCNDEQEFIDKSLVLIEKLRKAKRYDLMDIFFDDVPDLAVLKKTLDKIVVNITKVRNIPINKRHFDF